MRRTLDSDDWIAAGAAAALRDLLADDAGERARNAAGQIDPQEAQRPPRWT